jgi:hypothetical protein
VGGIVNEWSGQRQISFDVQPDRFDSLKQPFALDNEYAYKYPYYKSGQAAHYQPRNAIKKTL